MSEFGKSYSRRLSPEASELIQQTWQINELARALRMSMMVVDQMGLPPNIKDAVKKVQQAMMIIVELSRAIRLLTVAEATSNPFLAVLGVANIGMMLATSAKLAGGMI